MSQEPWQNGRFALFERPDEPIDAWLNRMWAEGWAYIDGAFQDTPMVLFRARRGRIHKGKFQPGRFAKVPGIFGPGPIGDGEEEPCD